MAAQELSIQENKEIEAKLQDPVEILNDMDNSNISPVRQGEASLIGSTQSSMVSLE